MSLISRNVNRVILNGVWLLHNIHTIWYNAPSHEGGAHTPFYMGMMDFIKYTKTITTSLKFSPLTPKIYRVGPDFFLNNLIFLWVL
jgi:hypothetical protein